VVQGFALASVYRSATAFGNAPRSATTTINMTATRQQLAERLISDVFDVGIGSNLEKALVENGMMDPLSWLACDDTVFQNMEFTDAGGVTKKLRFGDYHPIRILRAMVFHRRVHGEPSTYDGTEILQQEFEDFMGSNECISIMVPSLPVTGIMPAVHTEFATFQKAMKRDAGLYPVITQDAQWDTWNCSLVSIARAQAIDLVLGSSYVPVLPDEIALFAEKQMYMYSVFQWALQSDKGKAIVRSHETTHDAQKVYKDMYDYCSKSTRAVFGSSTMQSYTSSVRVGDGSWSASVQSDLQFGTASSAKLAQTRQFYAHQFDCVADENDLGSPVSVIQANQAMRSFGKSVVSLPDVIETYQHFTFDPGDSALDVMIDDPSRVVSLAEYPTDDVPETDLLACLTDRTNTDTILPEVLVRMTSNVINRHVKDKQGFRSHMAVTDSVSSGAHNSTSSGALADRGSNCRLAGSMMRVDIEAIVRHRMYRIPLGTAGTMVNTHFGSVIASVHNHALIGTGKTIHSVDQIEVSHNGVHDTSMRDDDQQPINWYPTTLDKDEWDNLTYIRPTSAADWYPTTLDKDEWDNLHHFSPTSAANWDSTTLCRALNDDDAWCNALCEILKQPYESPFHALTVFRSNVPVDKQLVHVLAPSSSKLRLAPIDREYLRHFAQLKEISPRQTSLTDNIVDLYRSSPSSPPPKSFIGCSILNPADLIGWLSPEDQDNGERPSSSSSPPKPIMVRSIKDPTDLIGWLFLKDKDNGERHRRGASSRHH
jgi:hypothetical protein